MIQYNQAKLILKNETAVPIFQADLSQSAILEKVV